MTWLLEDLHLFASFQHGRDRGSSSPLVPPMPSTWWRRAGVPPIWHPTMRCWSRLLDDVCVVHWAHVFFFFDIIFILLYLLSLPRTILNGEIIFEYILILHSSSHVEVMEHHSNIVPWQYLGCTGVMAIWMSWNTKRISSKAGNTKNWSETEVGWHHWRGAGRIGGKHLWISIYITQWLSISLCVKNKERHFGTTSKLKSCAGKAGRGGVQATFDSQDETRGLCSHLQHIGLHQSGHSAHRFTSHLSMEGEWYATLQWRTPQSVWVYWVYSALSFSSPLSLFESHWIIRSDWMWDHRSKRWPRLRMRWEPRWVTRSWWP